MSASILQFVPRSIERPAHLIRVAVPRLNKCDWVEEYLKQLDERNYDLEWAEVIETRVLSCAEWNELMRGFLTNREWLAGKGGTCSWNFPDDEREFFKMSEVEQEHWKRGAYILVVAVVCGGQTIYIDPQGYNYARYVAFPASGMQEGKTRQELERDRVKAECALRLEELKVRIANPPEVPADHGLRFYWNGIKHNGGKLVKCYFSSGELTNYPAGTLTVYARDYSRFPEEIARHFHIENNTDSQSDYFDDDKFRVCPNHPLYALVKAALDQQEAHNARRLAKKGIV